MSCDTRLKRGQTIKQRASEIRVVVERLAGGLATGRYQAVIDRRTGAVAFIGLADAERDGVTDACLYRRLMATGKTLAKQAVTRAEQLAGRSISREALASGVHSHDGGETWHHGH